MWPTKKAIGAQLSYGVSGNALLRLYEPLAAKVAPELVSPRVDDGPRLFRVVNSHTDIASAQRPAGVELDTASISPPRNMFSNSLFYVPRAILTSQLFEAAAVLDPTTYDPVYGLLLVFVETTMGMSVAFSTGETGLVLSLSVLKPRQRTVLGSSPDQTDWLLVPSLVGKPLQVSFSEPIKAIETTKGLVAVRTDAAIYVMRIETLEDSLKWKMLGDIPCGDLAGHGFADVSICPSDHSRLACVDTKGNFGIWTINPIVSLGNRLERVDLDGSDSHLEREDQLEASKSASQSSSATNGLRSTNNVHPSINDESDLSNWKRICWCQESNALLVLSRTIVEHFLTLPELTSTRLVTSNTWSRIRDFVGPEGKSKYAFMLTSKELIWFRLTNRLERLLSWKHFLLDNDPSLKLSVTSCENGKSFICLVYSQLNPVIFVYTFGFKDGLPRTLKDPYFFDTSEMSSPLHYLTFVKTNKDFFKSNEDEILPDSFCLFELSVNGALNFDVFSLTEGLSFDKHTNFNGSLKVHSNGTPFKKAASPRIMYSNMEMRLRDLALPAITDINKDHISNDLEVQEIQNYALKLGEPASSLNCDTDSADIGEFPSYKALLDIANKPPLEVDDLSEFDSMVEQLSGFYQSKGVKLGSLVSGSLLNRGLLLLHMSPSHEDGVEGVGNVISNIYAKDGLAAFNGNTSIKKTAILLAASLTKASAAGMKDFYTQRFENALTEAPEEARAILDKWTSTAVDVAEPIEIEFASQEPPVISSAPAINISSQKAPKKKSNRAPRSGFDLRSKSFQDSSQMVSQSGYVPSPLSQAQIPQSSLMAEGVDFSSQLESSQIPPLQSSPMKMSSQQPTSQKRMGSSQPMGSQARKKKKKKGGFA